MLSTKGVILWWNFFSPIIYKERKQAVEGKRKPHWLEYVGSS